MLEISKIRVCISVIITLVFFNPAYLYAQKITRPMIWVSESDRSAILQKIKDNQWASDYYNAFTKRVQPDLISYYKDPASYLRQLPFDFSLQKTNQIPPFKIINNADEDASVKRNMLQHFLKTGIDCGVLYYLTKDEKYAQYATSVFYTFIKSMLPLKPSENEFNGGFIYQDDHLREAREVGAQLPILYDFIYPYLEKGGMAYNFATKQQELVDEIEAEKICKTYIELALNRGIVNANWPILESPSLVCNILALGNQKERVAYLSYYLEKNTPHQDALPKVAKVFKEGGNWPESLNYSTAVTELTTYLMTLLTKLNPELHLGLKYPEVLNAVTIPYYLTYPNNNENIIFGDGHRDFHIPFNNYEQAYYLGQLEKSPSITNKFGSLIKSALADASYSRSKLHARLYIAHPYFDEPLKLLWYSPMIEGEAKQYPKPVTYELPLAGILLQRNLSSSNNSVDALMGFVGGGAFVHGHASGMNMELYGQGHVLGTKGGRGNYGSEIHENYYRLFAGHNTVVVNGFSRGAGQWVNLGINTVEKIASEPKPSEQPVSPNYSFTTSFFLDNKADSSNATQQRTVGIIRTSPTTAYYVDVFRSRSTLPDQYHDYIYHNVGEKLNFQTNDKNFVLNADSLRYQNSASKPWIKNKEYRNPGWHYFKNSMTSGWYDKSINVLFEAKALGKAPIKMKLFITGGKGRDYTSVLAPPSSESGKFYSNKLTPTLVIRQKGEAWDQPFAVVFESFSGDKMEGSVKTVENIFQNGIFKGLIVNSIVDEKQIKQIIISQDSDEAVFEDRSLSIKFKGRYAIITLDNQSAFTDVYIGSGSSLSFQEWLFKSVDAKPISLCLNKSNNFVNIISTTTFEIMNPKNFTINTKIINL